MITVFLPDGLQRRVASRLLGYSITHNNRVVVSSPEEKAWLLFQLELRARPGTENYRANQADDARVILNAWVSSTPEKTRRRLW